MKVKVQCRHKPCLKLATKSIRGQGVGNVNKGEKQKTEEGEGREKGVGQKGHRQVKARYCSVSKICPTFNIDATGVYSLC